ncbi:hypothetical protein HMPREF1555_00362 [Porphyromonas gingivalis F0570]|uniref:Uncharacterized protein n=1 Tax=Porphyromonas gingivalis F0570 TaxID=1227271 RepID=A0A0E2LTD0_PORGN|nr:hypothetical protein HMPREF1555_00362 [Porphyromonas gingivalis F0570]
MFDLALREKTRRCTESSVSPWKNVIRISLKLRAEKVFNNEEEFGMILNKHLKRAGF